MLRLLVFLWCLCVAIPAQAAWQVAETAHIRLHWDRQPDHVIRLAQDIEVLHRMMGLVVGRKMAPDMPKLDIFIVPRNADTRLLRERLVGGDYRASPNGIAIWVSEMEAWAPTTTDGYMPLQALYGRRYVQVTSPADLPDWYVLAVSQLAGFMRIGRDQITYGEVPQEYERLAIDGDWLPLERLLTKPGYAFSNDLKVQGYQAWLLLRYLQSTPELRAKLTDYLQRTGRGENSLVAFQAAIAPNLRALEGELRVFGRSGKMSAVQVGRNLAAEPPPKVVALSDEAGRWVLPMSAAQLAPDGKRKEALLTDIRKAASGKTDPDSRRAVAAAELFLGDKALARPLLDTLLLEMPDDATLWRWRGLAEDAGVDGASPQSVAAARKAFVRAFKIDPDDWRTLYGYARTYRPAAGPVPASIVDVLLRARTLAPEIPGISLLAGQALAGVGRREEAIATLVPILSVCDDCAFRGTVQALLDKLGWVSPVVEAPQAR